MLDRNYNIAHRADTRENRTGKYSFICRLSLLFIFIIGINQIYAQTNHSARAQGLGGAFTAISDDPNALNYNPAGISLFRENSVITHFTSMYNNYCPDKLGTGAIGYIHHFPEKIDLGISGDILYSDIYTHDNFGINAARRFSKMAIGIRANLLYTSYNEDNFVYGLDDDPNDPFFQDNGFTSMTFGMDAGFMYLPDIDWSFGLYLRNLVPPDNAIDADDESKHPLKGRAGAAYHWKNMIFALDAETDLETINDNTINIYLGSEARWESIGDNGKNGDIMVRGGANLDQLSVGFGYHNQNLFNLGFDYAFIYPLSRVGQEVPGSHKFTMSAGFMPKQPKNKETLAEESISRPEIPDSMKEKPQKPKVELTVSPEELYIAEVRQIHEEEPLIPVVFFSAGSDAVDSRFNNLLYTIGSRLANNPDVKLNIYGYYDPRSETNEGNLALERAEAIKRRFIKLVPECARNLKVVKMGYDIDHERAGLGRNAPTEEQQYMINEENRRGELRVEIENEADYIFFVDDVKARECAKEYNPFLKKNPDVDIIIEGGGRREDFQQGFKYQELLVDIIPDEYRERVYVSLKKSGENRVRLNAQGILFRPMQVRNSLDHSNIADLAKIEINHDVPAGFESYSIDIFSIEGGHIRNLDRGENVAPRKIAWDWMDKNNKLVDVNKKYLAKITGKDKTGHDIRAISDDTLQIYVTERERIESKLLIVQFVYDEDVEQAIYLEDRLEYITRRLIEFAKIPDKTLEVKITGHTDILGTYRRNTELSKERALAEYDNILKYLQELLDLDNQNQIENWLIEHDTNIDWAGYGPDIPYTIIRENGNSEREEVLGDNNMPEGRTINRRVVIEMILDTKDVLEDGYKY